VKERTVFAECREGAHERCAGADGTSDCACWHHIVTARHSQQIRTLVLQVDAEVERIWASFKAPRN
jgi:hypothetical protein